MHNKKLISHAWHTGGVKEYDIETGKILSDSPMEWGTTGFGSIWKQNGKVFALYHDDQSILLQCNTQKWRAIPEYTVSLTNLWILRNFKIQHQGKVVFSIWYKPKGLLFSRIDPTYDAIDAESDDFFLYLNNMWTSWINKLSQI